MENRTKPSPSPRPLPKGESEPLGSSGRAECAKAFGRVGDGRTAVAPTFGAWDRSRHSPSLDEGFSCSPSPRGRGRGEGEGINSEEPTGISRVDDAKASSSFVEQPASAADGVLLGEWVGVRGNEANSHSRRTTTPGSVKLRNSPGRTGGFPIWL